MAKLLNLDKFINENKIIRVQGMDFNIPGLISVEKVLQLSKLAQEVSADPAKGSEVLSEIWSILAPSNKDKTENDFKSRISAPMLGELIPYIFNDQGGEEVDSGIVDLSKNESGGIAQK